MARRVTKSVLRERGFTGMSTLNFEEVVKEIQSQCPKVYKILSQMVQLCIDPDKNKALLALIYGIIMFKRCKELSLVQRVNTVRLNDGGASQEVCPVLPCSADCSVLFTCYNKKKNNVMSTFCP